MIENATAPKSAARGLVCAAILSIAASTALASHVGEDLTVDQQAVTSTNQLLGALRQYESSSANQRATALQRLAQIAEQRRDRMVALIERNPKVAALRVLPAAVRSRLPAQALVERDASVVGVVQATVADDFVRGRSTKHFEVLDAAGQRFSLSVADASEREMLAMVGKRASVAGVQIDKHLLVLEKRNVQLLSAGGTTTTTPTLAAANPVVQGNQTTLVIMANFSDKANECTQSDLQGRLFGNSGATTNTAFQQSSGGLVSFSGQVIGPFPINYASTGTCDYNGWASALKSAALAAGINPSAYMRVSYAVPGNANCGWSGLGSLGGSQPTPTWVQQCTSTGIFSHELGHNLNFHHASTPGSEYGDASDPMGAAKLVQSNAANRVMAGWVSGSRLQDVSTSGSYAVTALESATTSPQVLRLAKPDTSESYYLSMRQPIGVDTALWSTYQNAVSVHKSTGTMPAHTYLLATLAVGQSWSDAANGIQVINQGVAGSAATVGVSFGGASCTRQPPAISASPASQSGAPGATLAYAVNIVNNNSAACSSSTFNLSQSLPAGFGGSFSSNNVTLAAGASANVSWNVASSSSSADAAYTVTALAAETSSGTNASTHGTYTVLTPPVAPPPPPPPPPPPSDTTPPVVSLTSPTAGSTVSGRVNLAAQASDNIGVAKVEFLVDGKLVATDASAPYAVNWNARKIAKGSHAITVRATDVNGNVAEQTVGITVN